MKDGLKYIVGKQIAAVVVAYNEKNDPHNQVFLVFPDGTSFEFWGPCFSCCSALDPAAKIESYVKAGGARVVAVYKDPVPSEDPDMPPWTLPKEPLYPPRAPRDELAAWRMAVNSIDAARRG